MDAAQWPPQQQIGEGLARTMEEIPIAMIGNNNNEGNNSSRGAPMIERRGRPQKEQNLNCPRCHSTNTKFCYYNNYSLTQPRYFCKSCRRYWTQGGSLRNVPVGGGSRKNKRSSSILASSSSSTSATTPPPPLPSKLIPDLNPPCSFSHLITASQNPKFLEGQDLNLAFPIQGIFQPMDHHLPKFEGTNNNNNNENHEPVNMKSNNNIPTTTTTSSTRTTNPSNCGGNNSSSAPLSALELLRTGIATRGSLNTFVPMPMPDSNTLYPSSAGGFPNLQEFKPNLASVFPPPGDPHQHQGSDNHDHHLIGSGGDHHNVGAAAAGARLFFPFADHMNKLASATTTGIDQHHHDHISDQTKGANDRHPHSNHHHQGPAGYWTGLLGGGTW